MQTDTQEGGERHEFVLYPERRSDSKAGRSDLLQIPWGRGGLLKDGLCRWKVQELRMESDGGIKTAIKDPEADPEDLNQMGDGLL